MNEEDLLADGEKAEMPITEEDEKALLDPKDELDGDDDLYDAAIEPSGLIEKKESVDQSTPLITTPVSSAAPSIVEASSLPPSTVHSATPTYTSSNSNPNRRFQCYVGNLTWWTTDEDLTKAVESYGVTDLIEIRFAENRQNGQSRGFAALTFASDTSFKTIMERLPGRQLHGNAVAVLPFNKQSQSKLEDASKGGSTTEKKEDKPNIPNLGTVRIGPQGGMSMINRPPQMINGMGAPAGLMNLTFPNNVAQGMAPSLMQLRTMPPGVMQQQRQMMPGGSPQMGQINRPPPNYGMANGIPGAQAHSNANAAQMFNSLVRNQQTGNPMNPLIPPGTHVNPNVYPYLAQQPKSDGSRLEVSPAEYEDIMNRNRTVSSSAISRAMSDAAEGHVNRAVDTLNTAMSLIKQSRIANSDACKSLLTTLQDALTSVESKREHSSSRKHRRRSRSPSERTRKHRRSRSRSRDRYSPRRRY
ncbi:RRM domain-containing protein [Aphelenchoides besseyi]|nr:RRM domain-containing protein [Aphelenchoides besseyi]KAI6207608.1 RRM domain-containing protein [Aphelenchoides besseyi]